MHRTSIFACTICAIGAAFPTYAQDFSGQFIGGSLGLADGEYDLGSNNLTAGGSPITAASIDIPVDDLTFGATYGRNWQNGNRVFGYVLSLSTGPTGTRPENYQDPTATGTALFCDTGPCFVEIDAVATVRGRYGAVVSDWLVFGSAGVATAKVTGGFDEDYGVFNEDNGIALGFVVSLGVERFVSSDWSISAELLHYDLGDLPFGEFSAPLGGDVEGFGDYQEIKFAFQRHF